MRTLFENNVLFFQLFMIKLYFSDLFVFNSNLFVQRADFIFQIPIVLFEKADLFVPIFQILGGHLIFRFEFMIPLGHLFLLVLKLTNHMHICFFLIFTFMI